MFWNGKNVFITGINGFLGCHLAKELIALNAHVFGLIYDEYLESDFYFLDLHKKVKVLHGSICDQEKLIKLLQEEKIDTIFHFAAQTQVIQGLQNPLETFETNIRGTYLLLEAARVFGGKIERIVIASSDKAYGNSDILPYKENFSLQGEFPYDVSKSCVDLLAQSYYKTYQLPLAIIRSANIYGPSDYNFDRLIPGCIRSLFFDERPLLRSDGSFMRNYIFVKDVVDGYLSVAEKLQAQKLFGEAFNLGSHDSYIVLKVVDMIATLMGKNHIKPMILNQNFKEIIDQKLCFEKAKSILNWYPKVSFQEGLLSTIQSYDKFFSRSKILV